jgi:hypothetical protein
MMRKLGYRSPDVDAIVDRAVRPYRDSLRELREVALAMRDDPRYSRTDIANELDRLAGRALANGGRR